MKTKKICMLASGGDAPGMNACMEAIYNCATACDWQVYVACTGFCGLVHDKIERATDELCTGISHLSGCVYRSGRCDEFKTATGFQKAVENIKKHDFDCVVVLGGNGSFNGLISLKKAGVNVIGIPCTIDNDVYYTKDNLGFSSACETVVQLIDNLKATMRTNERNHIVQLMGRDCYDLAMTAGIASFANVVDINERRYSSEEIAAILSYQNARGNKSCLIVRQEFKSTDVVQEAVDAAQYLRGIASASGDKRMRMNTLGHLQRGATPSCRDRFLAANYGALAVDLIKSRNFGMAIGLINDDYQAIALETAIKARCKFNKKYFELLSRIANR